MGKQERKKIKPALLNSEVIHISILPKNGILKSFILINLKWEATRIIVQETIPLVEATNMTKERLLPITESPKITYNIHKKYNSKTIDAIDNSSHPFIILFFGILIGTYSFDRSITHKKQ